MQTWNGTTWGNIIQLYGYGDDTNPETRNFDGDYLSNGDFIVVYDDFTFTTKYRIWNGTTWTNQASTRDTGGYPVWITVKNEPGTNRATAVVADYSRDTNTMFWNGSSWSNPVEHGNTASSTSLDFISFRYGQSNPAKGMLMYSQADWQFLWIVRDYKPNIRPLNNSTSWQNKIENVSIANSIETVELAARPGTNDFLGCMKDEANDISCFISRESNGYNWQNITGGPTIAANTDPGSQKSYALGFENVSGDLALVIYSNGSDDTARKTPKYRTYNPSSNSFSSERSMQVLDDSLKTVRVLPDFDTNDIMILLGDDSEDLYTIIWNGENNEFYSDANKGLVKQGASGSSGTDYWYDFDWGHDQN